MELMSDPVFGEVDITATARELACLASAIAEGTGFISAASASSPNGHTLTGIEVKATTDSAVCIRVDAPTQVLVISGNADSRAVLAENVHAMATADDGGHLHVDYFPGHPYLADGSLPLVINSPHGGMPTR
ncbi:hypothetical protein [Amycolatopsis sp. DSM 110486]|uniref:Imm32 family immunity protein n=1 Tax=Amycolatopsis sp. DSM 110486 TaxID=2865832 RepID=UPI001C6A2200|nr:hypothetical protein [Amycolatopsis sp. DSM 110486]QYN18681.1 hypothetical protein K1T34_39090 [Amycolatopsis sp. DSM 110486]